MQEYVATLFDTFHGVTLSVRKTWLNAKEVIQPNVLVDYSGLFGCFTQNVFQNYTPRTTL